jgi:hypothetical protein
VAADLLRPSHRLEGDVVVTTFGNGLVIRCETPEKDDPLRILSLGHLQWLVLNYLMNFPGLVAGRRVFEPFAGSGAFGFMALKEGACHLDLLDINPRARHFQCENAALNRIAPERVRAMTGDIARFTAEQRYDLVLANPPFLPVPEGIGGTLSSNGGPEGNRFVSALLSRLDEILDTEGHALVCLFQIVGDGVPLVARQFRDELWNRDAELSPIQEVPVPFDDYVEAYRRQHPSATEAIARWRRDLHRRWGTQLAVSYYLLEIGPAAGRSGQWLIRSAPAEKLGYDYLIRCSDDNAVPVDGRRR